MFCGEQWCYNPWDWMLTLILLRWAIYGAQGAAGGEASGENWA